MKNALVLSLLFGAGFLRSPGPAAALHSLCYSTTVNFQDGSVQPQFHTEGYLDGKLFLCYVPEKGQAEPCGPQTEAQLAAETSETKDLKDVGKLLRSTLAEILRFQGQKNGLHLFQEKRGCEMNEENLPRGFWNYFYDGEPFLSYDPDTQKWTAPNSSAQRSWALKIKTEWDAHSDKHKDYLYRVQGSICGKLQKYLKSQKNPKEQTVAPAVNVTFTKTLESNTTLICCASGFYPPKNSSTWLQDWKPMNQYSKNPRGVFSDGNGTCVSITVPQGQEQRYCCYLEHSQKNSTYCMSFEETSVQEKSLETIGIGIGIGIAAFLLVVAIVFALRWCKKKKKTSDVENPEQEVLSDGHQMETANHNGALLSAPNCTDSPGGV